MLIIHFYIKIRTPRRTPIYSWISRDWCWVHVQIKCI